ncbi:MAG: FGGY-family carbohydrate kinase, partial [Candidatus Cryptobacteroides sp.]
LTNQPVPASAAEYCRCIFLSLALRCRQVVEILGELTPVRIAALNVIGGGSRNAFLMQSLSDALGMRVVCGPVEGTAMGNALIQAKAAGLCGDLASMRRISKASVSLTEYLPKQNLDGEYARFLEIQKKYNTQK